MGGPSVDESHNAGGPGKTQGAPGPRAPRTLRAWIEPGPSGFGDSEFAIIQLHQKIKNSELFLGFPHFKIGYGGLCPTG